MRSRRGVRGRGLAISILTVGTVLVPALCAAQSPGFYTVTPCRAVDTRGAAGPFGGPALQAGTTRTLALAGACGTSASASAVAVNVTVSAPTTGGSLTIWPGDTSPTLATVISYSAGQTRANNALVKTNASGGVSILCVQASGSVHVIVDVVGYFLSAAPPPPPPGSLYAANLLPETGTVTTGSGSATVRLAPDERSGTVRFSFTALTAPVSGAHIHGPADPGTNGPILFDLDSAPPNPDGSFTWSFVPVGTATPASIVAALKAGRLYLNVHTSRYPSGEIRGHFGLVTGSTRFTPPPPPPPLPGGPPTAVDAARFLTQATFGPTLPEIARVQATGFDAWLNAQFAAPLTSHLSFLDAVKGSGENVTDDTTMESIWKQAISGGDQLRQRVALGLSEILVLSDASASLENEPYALSGYMDVLARDAFGNYRTLLEDVTLSPAMGTYLNMLGNDKENPETGQIPNENYAREILQLFSIGLQKLHPDGSLVLDERGLPIPTYNQDVVVGFAHALTGWSWGGVLADDTGFYASMDVAAPSWRVPMQPYPDHHSAGTKLLLDSVVQPGGGSPADDLRVALDNVFNHPNVGPFVARRLIQRLVTSNPSRGFVYRVARVFANNGSGARGDLKAVVRSILLDWEARSADVLTQQAYGKQREPILRFTNVLRAKGAYSPTGRWRIPGLEDQVFGLGQNPLRAPSVFNFFVPDHAPAGTLSQNGLVAPEFQITSEAQAIGSANFIGGVCDDGDFNLGNDHVFFDLSPYLAVQADPVALVGQLDQVLTSGGMSAPMKSVLVQMLNETTSLSPEDRVKAALRVIATSPEFAIQK